MGRLTMLKPRLSNLDTRRVTQTQATERIRGRALQTIRDRILKRDNGLCQCAQCRRTGDINLAEDVDHDVPLWAGGPETDSNRISIARACHDAKTACEAAMRASAGYLSTPCTCGRHGQTA
jgi:5-methylcytosine-specific restriction endonuclease McrA